MNLLAANIDSSPADLLQNAGKLRQSNKYFSKSDSSTDPEISLNIQVLI